MSWLRLYTDILKDAKVMQLGGSHFKTWVLCLCTAKENDGRLPVLNELAFALRLRKDVCEQHLKVLVEAGLIDVEGDEYRPHNWDSRQFVSDDVNARVKAFRDRKRNVTGNVSSNVTGNAHETEMKPLARAQTQSTDYREESPTPFPGETPAATPDLSGEFDRLWKAYPQKGRTRRISCEAHYSQLLGHLEPEPMRNLANRILAPILPNGKWIASAKWSEGFVHNLDTYLLQHMWDEDPEPANNSHSQYDHIPYLEPRRKADDLETEA